MPQLEIKLVNPNSIYVYESLRMVGDETLVVPDEFEVRREIQRGRLVLVREIPDEQPESTDDEGDDEEDVPLESHSRPFLNELAISLGLDPADYKNKPAIAEAIAERQANPVSDEANADQDEATDGSESDEADKTETDTKIEDESTTEATLEGEQDPESTDDETNE